MEEEGVKWVTHYSSDHQILLVGDGDFSFSLSLAKAFGSASNIVASSFDSYAAVTNQYKLAKSNLDELQKLGACLLHEVDATKMKSHSVLKMRRFDRVIFNFPHAGFYGKEDNTLVIGMHKNLVLGFFKNARRMLRANGEIHVNHKTTAPFSNWDIENLALQCFLTLSECSDFKKEDYPGYNNKRGAGDRPDEPFPLGKCSTFKFIRNPKAKSKLKRRMDEMEQLPTFKFFNHYPQTSHIHLNHFPQRSHIPKMNEAPTSIHQNHYPRRSHIPKMNEAPTSLHRNHYPHKCHIPRMNEAPISLYVNHFTQASHISTINEAPTSLHLNHYPQTSHFPKMNESPTSLHLNHYPHRSHIPRMNEAPTLVHLNHFAQANHISKMNEAPASLHLNHYPQTGHNPNLNERVTSIFGLTNEYPPISRGYFNNVEEIHGRDAPSCMNVGSKRSFQPWSTSTNIRSNYLEEALGNRAAQKRGCYPFERYIGAGNEGNRVYEYGGFSNYLEEKLGNGADQKGCFSFQRMH